MLAVLKGMPLSITKRLDDVFRKARDNAESIQMAMHPGRDPGREMDAVRQLNCAGTYESRFHP